MAFAPLTWNAESQATPTGRQTRFGVKWRNYLAADGWERIDLTPRQVSRDWVFNRSPYALTVPTVADGWLTFESTNSYDIWTKRIMPDAKVGIQKRYPGALAGLVAAASASGLLFSGAFPVLGGADRLIQPHEQKVRDLIVFHVEPPGNGPVEVDVEIEFGSLPILESDGNGRQPKPADFQNEKHVDLGLTFSDGGSFRGVKVKQPLAWDSSGRVTPIKLKGKVVGTRFVGQKVIPRSVFKDAIYPIYADTTTTFYPDPNPETTTCDGWMERSVKVPPESWATMRSGNGTTAIADGTPNYCRILQDATGLLWVTFDRSICLFDTSSIPDTDTVSAATLTLQGTTDVYSDQGSQSVALTPGTSASNTDIVSTDFQSNTSSTDWGSMTVASWQSAAVDNVITLNSTGLAGVSKTGITKIAVKMGGDASNTEPSLGSNGIAGVTFRSAEASGTINDPRLIVTYAPSAGDVHSRSRFKRQTYLRR